MRFLITGGCGFLGSNLAQEVLRRGEELQIFDSLHRAGAEENLQWLRRQGTFSFEHGDIRNGHDVERTIADYRPQVVFHLAGQVAATTSLSNPRLDFETNALGSFNLLEAIRRHAPAATVLYSSTNKVYGDLSWVRTEEHETRYLAPEHPDGFDESIPFRPETPYGVSKGAADSYMLDFARMYDLRTVVFRHSSMYGARQFASFEQGWVGWFCRQALALQKGAISSFTIAGTGKQVRDVLHGDDLQRLYFSAVERIDAVAGQAFNIGGGPAYSLSLLELFALLEEFVGRPMTFEQTPWRPRDQRVFVADAGKAARLLGWRPQVPPRDGVARLLARHVQ